MAWTTSNIVERPILTAQEQERLLARARAAEAERDELRLQVLQLQRQAQVGLITGGLAHDLSNQLTRLMGAAELGLMDGSPDALKQGLETSLEQGHRIQETVDAFLNFIRSRERRVRNVSVPTLVEGALRLVEPAARAAGVRFLHGFSSRTTVRADRQLLEQVLVNLCMNAIRAAGQGAGRVMVSATDSGSDRVRICVRDTGPGIRPDVRARLFRPFVTGHRGEGGTGLGLYVARQIVQRYGGTIRCESTSAGTRMDVELPTVSHLD